MTMTADHSVSDMSQEMWEALQNNPCALEHPQTSSSCIWLLPTCVAQGPFRDSTPGLVLARHQTLKHFGDTIAANLTPMIQTRKTQKFVCYPYLEEPFIKTDKNWSMDSMTRKTACVATEVPWLTVDTLLNNISQGQPGSYKIFASLALPMLFHLCLRFVCAIGKTELESLWITKKSNVCHTIHLSAQRRQNGPDASFVRTLLHTHLNDCHRYILEVFLDHREHWRELKTQLTQAKASVSGLPHFGHLSTRESMNTRFDLLMHMLVSDYGKFDDLLDLLPPYLPNLPPPSMDDDWDTLAQRLLSVLPKERVIQLPQEGLAPKQKRIRPSSLLTQFTPLAPKAKTAANPMYFTMEDICSMAAALRYYIWHKNTDCALNIVGTCPSGMLSALCNHLVIICVSDIGVANPRLVLAVLGSLKNNTENLPQVLGVVKDMCNSAKSRLSHWMMALYGCESGRRLLHQHGLLDSEVQCTPELIIRQHPLATQLCVQEALNADTSLFATLRRLFSESVINIVMYWHQRGSLLPTPCHVLLFLVLMHLTGRGVKEARNNDRILSIPLREKYFKTCDREVYEKALAVGTEKAWLQGDIMEGEKQIRLQHGMSLADLLNMYKRITV